MRTFLLLLGLVGLTPNLLAAPPDRATFIAETARQTTWTEAELTKLLDQAKVKQSILRAMRRPGEAKPWPEYRELFVTPSRVQGGQEFLRLHAAALREAARAYGVPREIITAIIGIETEYGKVTGNYRVLDALVTLGFHYPPRGEFFQQELAAFLQMVKEQGFDPLNAKGSYAGAMGIGQFIPSSYRKYAVDFDQDGQKSPWQTVDVIGSVGFYLQSHGWQAGQPILHPATASEDITEEVLEGLPKEPTESPAYFARLGIEPTQSLKKDTPVYLIHLEGEKTRQYWLGQRNFYVITRYNRSWKYAMAVVELARAIAQKKG